MPEARLEILGVFKDRASKGLSGLQKKAQGLKSALTGTAAKITAAFGGGALLSGIISTNAEFDRLEAQIKTFSGSAEEASASMALIQDITSKTPFQLNEVTTAFTRMKALGLEPSREALMAFGDVAAGSGKSILQFTEAVADAAVGEFERMKEFGVKMSKEGDKVRLTFKGVTQEINNDGASIQAALVKLGQTEFGGAMETQMKTFSGALSNMKDQFALVARALGEAGLNDLIIGIANALSKAAKWILKHAGDIREIWISMGTVMIKRMEQIRYGFEQFRLHITHIFNKIKSTVAVGWNALIESFERGHNALAKIIPGMEKINLETKKLKVNLEEGIMAIRMSTEAHKRNMEMIEETHLVRLKENDAAQEQNKTLEEQEKILADAAEQRRKETKALNENTEATKKNTKARKEDLTVYQRTLKHIKDERIEREQAADALVQLKKDLEAGKITAAEFKEQEERLKHILGENTEKTKKLSKETKELGKTYKKTKSEAEEAAQGMQSSLGNVFESLIRGTGDVKSAIAELASSFIDLIFAQQQQPVAATPAPVPTGGGGGGGFLSGIGDFFSGLFRQEGGPMLPKTPYFVHKNEWVVPQVHSMALTPQQAAHMGEQRKEVHQHFHAHSLDPDGAMKLFYQHRRSLTELVNGTNRTFREP